jgi:hypothetical protein
MKEEPGLAESFTAGVLRFYKHSYIPLQPLHRTVTTPYICILTDDRVSAIRKSSFLVSPRTTNTFNDNNKKSALTTLTSYRIYTKISTIKVL